MNGRPILRTLAALFLLAGAGQVVGAIAFTAADAGRLFNETPAAPSAMVRADGLVVREDGMSADAAGASLPDLTAERIELRQAAAEMKRERAKMEEARAALEGEKAEERRRLVALYARMPAARTATIMEALSPEEAAGFIAAMPQDAGAAVLAELPDEQAVAVTRALVARGF